MNARDVIASVHATMPAGHVQRIDLWRGYFGAALFAAVIVFIAFALTDLVIAALVVADVIRTRRLHPAFGWGFAFVVATQVLRLLLAATPQWNQFATWLTL